MNSDVLEVTPTARDIFLSMIPDRAWLDEKIKAGEIVMIPDKAGSPCNA